MARQRARLKDNDPLSPTDEVLAGLEQVSKSTSQQPGNSEGQEANKSTIRKATFQLSESAYGVTSSLKQLWSGA